MKNQNRKNISYILLAVALNCLAVANFFAFRSRIQDWRSQKTVNELRAQASSAPEASASSGTETNAETSASFGTVAGAEASASSGMTADTEASVSSGMADDTKTSASSEASPPAASPSGEPVQEAVENPYRDAFLSNEDMAAWIQIPGTNIDYPVMWTPEDETYYLYRDFDGSENKNGCLILDTDSCVDPLTTNLIIHGHNMRSGAMFGNLTDYERETYCQEHNEINLYTRECQRRYEVIAVFRSQVYRKSDQVFKFYQFFQADSQEEFDDFYDNIKNMSIYDTGVTAEFGDHFITLSTCVYHVENGRFVVVAKEVEKGDTYLPISK